MISAVGEGRFTAVERLDDGSPLSVTIDVDRSRIHFDFSESGGVHPGNLNATPSIVRSVVLYVLRLIAGGDVPLNEGLLDDVEIVLGEGLLSPGFPDDPRDCPAVSVATSRPASGSWTSFSRLSTHGV